MRFLMVFSLELLVCACGSTPPVIARPTVDAPACDEYWDHPPGPGLTFESGEATLGAERSPEIDLLAHWLEARVASMQRIVVEGGSDACGEHAQVEGQRRADALATMLRARFERIEIGAVSSPTPDFHLGCARADEERRSLRYARVAVVLRGAGCETGSRSAR
jgi:hypothetical protein